MNRTLKRPMFRIGGPVNQGSGIMSHVEPKRHYVMGGRVGFKVGGTGVGNFNYQDQFTLPQYESGLGILQRNNSLGNSGSYSNFEETIPVKTSTDIAAERRAASDAKIAEYNRQLAEARGGIPTVSRPEIKRGLGFLDTSLDKEIRQRQETSPGYQQLPYTAAEKAQLGNTLSIARDQGKLYDTGANTMEGPDRPATIEKKEPEYTDTTKTDPKAEIRKDAALLKELLHGEDYQDMSKGEVALVLARALAEPGPIGNKLKVASELSIPLIKAKKGEDKEAVLEAYKAYREREKAEITAGKQGVLEKDARALAAAYINANPNDPNTKTQEGRAKIYKGMLDQRLSGESKLEEKVKAAAFTGIQPTLESKNNAVRKTEADIAAGKKLSKSELETHEDNKNYIQYMKKRFPEYTGIYGNKLATGGRVKLADGTEDPDTTTEDDTTTDDTVESTTTSADAGTQQTQLKPVVKLSFQELRSRLPKEITNDIVGMLASSEEALQDFAYIKTQQDVNNFNVKYGVNLVLPSTR